MSLVQLIQLVPPPTKPFEIGSPKGWKIVQERLGVSFPPDYKSFIDCYGTGTFNDFITPYNPFTSIDYLNTFQVLDAHHQARHQPGLGGDTSWSVVAPFDLYPAPDGLLPWGTTTKFDHVFFWQITGLPESWVTIFYNLRVGEYEVWKIPFTSFLVKLFQRKIESVLLPKDFLSESGNFYFQPLKTQT